MQYTKKEYDILLYLRKKPRKTKRIFKRFKPADNKHWNIWLSDLSKLYYVEPGEANVIDCEGVIHLNEQGETVAQAEYDRRFDMYFTRIVALLALLASLFAIGLDAAQSVRGSQEPQCQCTTTYCECDL